MSDKDRTFELGLVMAGAISAGAYTGGVIDFLIEALDSWEAAKAATEDGTGPVVPPGTSAGGMTTAIAGAALGGDIEPVRELGTEDSDNRLYNCWVEKIDISYLLDTEDLEKEETVVSLLDSTVLEEIVNHAIDIEPSSRTRNYGADPLRIILTATNLRGIPYNIKLAGVDGTSGSSHGMRAHADFLEFDISSDDPKSKGVRWLDSKDYSGSGQIGWQAFGATALATGAFPVGLAPRVLSQEYETYQNRTWPVSLETEDALQQGTCQEFRSVPSELEGDDTFHLSQLMAVS